MSELFTGKVEVKKSASDANITVRLDAVGGNAWLGGHGTDGDLVLFPLSGDNNTLAQATFHLDAGGGNAWLGGHGTDGDLVLFPFSATNIHDLSQATIHLEAEGGNAWLGGPGTDGDLVLFSSSATNNKDLSQATIHLDGQTGDITLNNADCAEEFDVAVGEAVEPGTVMVIDDEGKLRPSTDAYNKRVAGVISGAGDYKPGLVLDRQVSSEKRLPLSLMGKSYCKVDAQYAPIEVGDLLTTSPTLGHAMKATDPAKAFGTIIGKALRPLKEGTGMIPMLISLQ